MHTAGIRMLSRHEIPPSYTPKRPVFASHLPVHLVQRIEQTPGNLPAESVRRHNHPTSGAVLADATFDEHEVRPDVQPEEQREEADPPADLLQRQVPHASLPVALRPHLRTLPPRCPASSPIGLAATR